MRPARQSRQSLSLAAAAILRVLSTEVVRLNPSMSIDAVQREVARLTDIGDYAIGDDLVSAFQLQSFALGNMLDDEYLDKLVDYLVRTRRGSAVSSL